MTHDGKTDICPESLATEAPVHFLPILYRKDAHFLVGHKNFSIKLLNYKKTV